MAIDALTQMTEAPRPKLHRRHRGLLQVTQARTAGRMAPGPAVVWRTVAEVPVACPRPGCSGLLRVRWTPTGAICTPVGHEFVVDELWRIAASRGDLS